MFFKDTSVSGDEVPPTKPEQPVGAETGAASAPRRVLVVDDDAEIRLLNTQILLASGYEVDAEVDGAAAWEKLQHNHYDLLVTDNNMPNLTGLELIKKLHELDPHMPAIMATGNPPCLDFAADYELKPAVLLKPFTLSDLLAAVKKVLEEPLAAAPHRQLPQR